MSPRILVLAGSLRRGSFNQRLADLAAARLEAGGAQVASLSLADYPLPLHNQDLEAKAMPAEALALHAQLRAHDGVFLASPENNANVSPLLVNAIAWVSRVRSDGGIAAAFGRPVFALGAASPGPLGGYRGLMALRNMLELGLSARVLPEMASVPAAHEGFGPDGGLANPRVAAMLERAVDALLAAAAKDASG